MRPMKKILVTFALALAVVAFCSMTVSCASSDGAVMNQNKHKKSSVIKSNYKVKGSNRYNSNTYNAR